MLRRRILEIDREIDRLERETAGLRLVSKQRCVPTRRPSGRSLRVADIDRQFNA